MIVHTVPPLVAAARDGVRPRITWAAVFDCEFYCEKNYAREHQACQVSASTNVCVSWFYRAVIAKPTNIINPLPHLKFQKFCCTEHRDIGFGSADEAQSLQVGLNGLAVTFTRRGRSSSTFGFSGSGVSFPSIS